MNAIEQKIIVLKDLLDELVILSGLYPDTQTQKINDVVDEIISLISRIYND